MNKKAVVDDMFDLIAIALGGFFLLLFLNLALNGAIKEGQINTVQQITATDAKENLLFYLHAPVQDIGTMTDLITLWQSDKNKYKTKLETESLAILKKIITPHSNAGWNVRIHSPDNTKLDIINVNIIGFYENQNTFITLPDKTKVEIYLECQDVVCNQDGSI